MIEAQRYDMKKLERLAKLLHESGREAVEKRLIYRDDLPVKPFAEWDDLNPAAREGRRLMAEFLILHADEVVPLLIGHVPTQEPRDEDS